MPVTRTNSFPYSEALRFRRAFVDTYLQSGIENMTRFFTDDFLFIENGQALGAVQFFRVLARTAVRKIVFNVFLKAAYAGDEEILVKSYDFERKLIGMFTLVRDYKVQGGYKLKKVEAL